MFTIKKIAIYERLSEETIAFNADIWLDGKKVGSADNEGRGGPNRYEWSDREAGKRIEAWADAQPTEFDFEKLDQLVGGMLDAHRINKRLASLAKKSTLFRLPEDKRGEWRTIKAPYTAAVEAHIRSKYPAVECIANADLDVAVAFC